MRKPLVALLFTLSILFFAKTTVYAETYTVQRGDTLSSIAKQQYGDSSRWKEIFEANTGTIKDPNMLSIGWVLGLPEEKVVAPKNSNVSRGKVETKEILLDVKATAYDLSVASCGKTPKHPGYGQTRSGRQIDGFTRLQAACVAVDPKVIPLGSSLYVSFEDPYYWQYNGVYQALDTGGAIKGRSIDVFLGDFNSTKESSEVTQFGVTKAKVIVLRKGW